MAIIRCRPTSPGRRHMVKVVYKELYQGRPYKPLVEKLKRSHGRDSAGRISVRHIGGGSKRLYRIIDFKRNKKDGIPAKVERLEYDPNRSAHIALICYRDGERSYILAPQGLKVGDLVESGVAAPIKLGNTLPLQNIPEGFEIHNIELKPGCGGQIVRSAGTSAKLVAKGEEYSIIRLPSGETRFILNRCRATLGSLSARENKDRSLGKAGASRWRGIRPTVRGTAMNPVDHPHGGGEGKNFGKHPVTPWGLPTKGKKTRCNKRTDRFIVRRRNSKSK